MYTVHFKLKYRVCIQLYNIHQLCPAIQTTFTPLFIDFEQFFYTVDINANKYIRILEHGVASHCETKFNC